MFMQDKIKRELYYALIRIGLVNKKSSQGISMCNDWASKEELSISGSKWQNIFEEDN
jgi:hypothetical protein